MTLSLTREVVCISADRTSGSRNKHFAAQIHSRGMARNLLQSKTDRANRKIGLTKMKCQSSVLRLTTFWWLGCASNQHRLLEESLENRRPLVFLNRVGV